MHILACKCTEKWANWAPLVLRIALGVIFTWHGYDKLFVKGIPMTTGFLGSIGIPLPGLMAYIVSYGELVFGLFLILGFLTHWASKFALVVALVAFFTVHVANGFSIQSGGYEFIILIGAAAFSLMITGAGKYSVDAQWFGKHKPHA